MAATQGLVAIGLVQKVRRDTGVGHFVHLFGANLHLDGHPVHTHQNGVQRLIAIGLGDGNIIFKLTGHRLVLVVNHPQRPVTGVYAIDDNPKRVDIHNLFKKLLLLPHFLINAVQVFLAANHHRVDFFAAQTFFDGRLNLLDQLFAIAASRF